MPLGARTSEVAGPEVMSARVEFSALPGWGVDDHLAAFQAFLRSARVLTRSPPPAAPSAETPAGTAEADLIAVAARALALDVGDAAAARAFFETYFSPHRVVHAGAEGLLTGYYEPVLAGSRQAEGMFCVPVYRRPPDLVNLVREEQRGARADAPTHARKTATGTVPYATRAEIENGALAGQGLELVWLADPVDAFFLHVQGSGRVRLAEGGIARVGFAAQNGHPYVPIGRVLVERGAMTLEQVSMQSIRDWLRAHPAEAREVMRQNPSYVFFRELRGLEPDEGPPGAFGAPLTPGRSIAVDHAHVPLGIPIWLDTRDPTTQQPLRRLVLAQDVGGAVRGPVRGDLFWGWGAEAEQAAGRMRERGLWWLLLPVAVGTAEAAPVQPPSSAARTRAASSSRR